MNEDQIEVVTLIDEDDNEVQFDHLMTFDHSDQRFIALMPMSEVDGIDEGEVLILRIQSDGEEDTYIPVESESLLNEVFETFLKLYEEMIENDDEQDE